ncbi:class I SAM-dependent methyltransferase [Cytobacillus sp. Sa5YUA1]|uniref:S-adenosyl-L-methionine-dependent methyltransferase n=1 Tax=Cytobacillus stercorigallinarum TaxID=2762240 RepID=A0ABR8QSE1_9BACI|nr:class I SAM-dependent methyltransferase [Cytobacillus stercorigallinarum]MBD7938463.1 class I SAM-dependent methyltransferase [Cytobacillus stercorigallinarum]
MKEPDHTAVRVSLWRGLHLIVDEKPNIFHDNIGLKLISPNNDWQKRPDMDVANTSAFRASIVARARFVDDLVVEQFEKGIDQYVILGTGLDTFAQRHQEVFPQMTIYEMDQVDTQLWKKKRLEETGYSIPDYLKFVPVNFEENQGWLDQLKKNGFDDAKPAVVVSTIDLKEMYFRERKDQLMLQSGEDFIVATI